MLLTREVVKKLSPERFLKGKPLQYRNIMFRAHACTYMEESEAAAVAYVW